MLISYIGIDGRVRNVRIQTQDNVTIGNNILCLHV